MLVPPYFSCSQAAHVLHCLERDCELVWHAEYILFSRNARRMEVCQVQEFLPDLYDLKKAILTV
jgi:hypothetical protein